MTSMENGKALNSHCGTCKTEVSLYISPATEVYEGMIIGNTSKR